MTSPRDFTRETIAKHLHVDIGQATDDACIQTLGADSLDLIEIGITIEEHYAIDLENSAFADSKTVGDAVAAVENAVLADISRDKGDALAGEAA